MLAALVSLFLAQATPEAPVAEKAMLLVMPLRAEPKLAASARALDELILEAVDGLKRYQVLGSSDLNALLGVEKMKDAIACDDTVCAAEIGGALGAPYLLAGELRALDQQVVLSLRLMDTKKQTVTARATARGSTSAESLSQMMAQVVGTCFKTTVQTVAVQTPSAESDYSGYMSLVTELGGYATRSEYSSFLGKLEELKARAAKVKTPPGGASGEELLTYYQALACFTLKREACLRAASARYQKDWAAGLYRTGIDSFVTTMDDQKTAQRDHEAEVKERIADIREKAKAGTYDALQTEELVALAYYGGQDYAPAAKHFAQLLDKLYAEKPAQLDKIMSTTSLAVLALQQVGEFDAARAALKKAETLDAKAYRTSGLQQTARSLPK
ncbi:MAG: hypothetical protein ACAI38_09920 [Myxococcota bacterium]